MRAVRLVLAGTAAVLALGSHGAAAQPNPEPMIFFVAKGEPNACGPGCSEWIAAEGMFDGPRGRTTIPRSARHLEGPQLADRVQFTGRRHRGGARPGANFARTQNGRQRGRILSGRMQGAHSSRRILPPDHGGEPRIKGSAPHRGRRVFLRVRLCLARSVHASCASGCAGRNPRRNPDGCIVPARVADCRANAQQQKALYPGNGRQSRPPGCINQDSGTWRARPEPRGACPIPSGDEWSLRIRLDAVSGAERTHAIVHAQGGHPGQGRRRHGIPNQQSAPDLR